MPSRATYELNGEELILLPNAQRSLESERVIIKVGDNTQGVVLTNRFIPLRPHVSADYLVLILNTQFVRDQLIASCRGAGSPDLNSDKLQDIMIPVPESTDLSSIDVFMDSIADTLAHQQQLEKQAMEASGRVQDRLQSLFSQA